MDWPIAMLVIFGSLVILMLTGMPIAFAFMGTCVLGVFLFWGGLAGMQSMLMSFFSAIAQFVILPVPLFILMGCIIFESGVGALLVEAVDKLLGRLPGRLGLLAIISGTLLGTMMGISAGSIAILGKGLLPEMTKRGYHKSMTLGPIVICGLLAVLIPPSAPTIVLGAIGNISIGKMLIAIIMPGLLAAFLFSSYIIIRAKLQPALAPIYDVGHVPLKEQLFIVLRNILPLGIIIFAVIGTIYTGIATPTEAAALGVIASYLLAALYKKLNWQTIKRSATNTVYITVMALMIITASITFSRILAYSGAVRGLVEMASNTSMPPILMLIITQIIILFLGCFMDGMSIIMITVPVFVPIMKALGFDLVWWGVLVVINIQLGCITPPFGLDCYTLKGLAPADVTLSDVFRSAMPFFALGLLLMALIVIFPQIALWLPGRSH
jgi:tripartite ATP-independent transporter DctM subunit